MSTTQQSDTPDTPPEVLAKQAASRALNRETASLLDPKSSHVVMGEDGKLSDGYTQMVRENKAAVQARKRAEAYVGGEPLRGLDLEQAAKIKGKAYPLAPKMDPELGDRTAAFVNWLFAHHPADAKVRYAYRDIWPTVLPPIWPVRELIEKYEGASEILDIENPQAELVRLRAEVAALRKPPVVKKPAKAKLAPVKSGTAPAFVPANPNATFSIQVNVPRKRAKKAAPATTQPATP